MTTSERCETCRFWRQFNPPEEGPSGFSWPNGVCRRYGVTKYHPCIGPNPFPPYGSPWPWTAHDDWCGEWTANEGED